MLGRRDRLDEAVDVSITDADREVRWRVPACQRLPCRQQPTVRLSRCRSASVNTTAGERMGLGELAAAHSRRANTLPITAPATVSPMTVVHAFPSPLYVSSNTLRPKPRYAPAPNPTAAPNRVMRAIGHLECPRDEVDCAAAGPAVASTRAITVNVLRMRVLLDRCAARNANLVLVVATHNGPGARSAPRDKAN